MNITNDIIKRTLEVNELIHTLSGGWGGFVKQHENVWEFRAFSSFNYLPGEDFRDRVIRSIRDTLPIAWAEVGQAVPSPSGSHVDVTITVPLIYLELGVMSVDQVGETS